MDLGKVRFLTKKIWTYALKMFPLMKRKGKNVKTKSGCWCENKFAVWIVCTAEDDCVLQCCFLFDCLAEHFWQTLLAVLGIFSATRIHIRFWSEFSLCCPLGAVSPHSLRCQLSGYIHPGTRRVSRHLNAVYLQ